MQTTNIAIWILSVLDGALFMIVPLVDRRWYRHVCKQALQYFFCNTIYDDQVNRFMLSKGRVPLLTIGFISMLILTKFGHAASF